MITSTAKLKAVRNIVLERPADAGDLWQGVPHSAFIDAMTAELMDYGYQVGTVRAATSVDGVSLVASFPLKVLLTKDLNAAVTLVTANDRHTSPKVYYGATDEQGLGYALWEWPMGRLYKDFDVPLNCAAAVAKIKEWKAKAAKQIWVLQNTKMDANEAVVFLATLARDTRTKTTKIPWANVAKTDYLFNKGEDLTRWGLYRAFSKVTQRDPPLKQVPRLLLFAERLREAA